MASRLLAAHTPYGFSAHIACLTRVFLCREFGCSDQGNHHRAAQERREHQGGQSAEEEHQGQG